MTWELGDGYLTGLDVDEQQLMVNFIIQQIAVFRHHSKAYKATQ